MTTTTSADAVVKDEVCSILVKAGQEMAARASVIGYDWSVFSVTDQAAYEITDLYCDNAWDIQRRRGLKATARTTGVVSV